MTQRIIDAARALASRLPTLPDYYLHDEVSTLRAALAADAPFTDWIDGRIAPEHVGVYQRDYRETLYDADAGIAYAYWDGQLWGTWGVSPDEAFELRADWSNYQPRDMPIPWRGLQVRPE